MSRIFLSHASANNRDAIALKQWLAEQNPRLAKEIFLDFDPHTGIRTGEEWKESLRRASARCEAVVCLLSNEWESSAECLSEYRTAEMLDKRVFCARLEPDTGTKTSAWQWCDLFGDGPITPIDIGDGDPVRFATRGLYRLRDGIHDAGIGADTFPWPVDEPDRALYRGWAPFDPVDAGIFFGRDAQIVRAFDAVRGMHKAQTKRWLVILGPSGSGKSSFLRAGLVPRLRRDDREFLVLGMVRPERDALAGATGLAKAIDAGFRDRRLSGPPLGEIKAACLGPSAPVRDILLQLRDAAQGQLLDRDPVASPLTVVLPLDQAEELLTAQPARHAERFLALLRDLVVGSTGGGLDMMVAATIRSEHYERLQTRPELADVDTELFGELKPMPSGRFQEVICRPAQRATEAGRRLELEPELVDRLLEDCKRGSDTLPLLSLTLFRLYEDYGSSGQLSLTDYTKLGGLRRVVQTEIDEILSADPEQRHQQLESLRGAFIPWLSAIDPDTDAPVRRQANWADLPHDSRPLVDRMVDKRLLVTAARDNDVVVEVALESLLRKWDQLAGWLADQRQNLKTADDLHRIAAAWRSSDHDPAWLLTGTRLGDAETLAATPEFQQRLTGVRDFLAASHEQAQATLRAATAQKLIAQAQGMLASTQPGGDARAFQQILAAYTLTHDDGALYTAVVQRASTLKIITGHTDAVTGVVFSPDGQRLASASKDATVRVWDAATGQPVGSPLTGHSDAVTGVVFSPDGHRVASASRDRTVLLWDAATGQPVGGPLTGHTAGLWGVVFSPDGRRLASASRDRTVRLWDADTGQPVGGPLTGHTDTVTGVVFSPDGCRLASASWDRTVRLWDADTGQPVGGPLTGHTDTVTGVVFSPDGRRLASASRDRTVLLWDAATGQPVGGPLTGHTAGLWGVVFSPDGRRLASASRDRTVRLWDADTGQPVGGPLTGHTDTVTGVVFSPDGRRLASASWDRTVRLWDADTGQPLGIPLTGGHTSAVWRVVFSPDGHRLASASADETLRLWDAHSGQPLGNPLTGGHTGAVWSVVFSPDGHRLASASKDKTLRLWDADTGQPVGNPLTGHTGAVSGVVFSPDGLRVATGSSDATVRLWDADTGQPVGNPLTGHTGTVWDLVFSPDGLRLASASADKTLRLWDADTGQPVGAPLTGHTDEVDGVAFSPDGHHLVSASVDSTVRMWDADTGQPVGAPLTGHTGAVWGVAFSPDGHRLVSAGDDATVRVWDADTGQPVGAPLTGHTSGVTSVAFSPDGHRLASASKDTTVRVWPAEASPDMLCAKLTANMSHQQWRDWVSPDIEYTQVCPNLPIPR